MEKWKATAKRPTSSKRVVLPSGKTIEVVYFRTTSDACAQAPPKPARAHQDLHVCIDCDSELVYPVQWDEAGPRTGACCSTARTATSTARALHPGHVEAFDEELDRGADALARDYKRLMRANMAEEIERFVGALEAGAILPEDF